MNEPTSNSMINIPKGLGKGESHTEAYPEQILFPTDHSTFSGGNNPCPIDKFCKERIKNH